MIRPASPVLPLVAAGGAAAAIALVLGVLTVAALDGSSRVAVVGLLLAVALAVTAVVGSLRVVLLGLIVLDMPLQWDVQLPFGVQAPDVGGVVAGLPLSLTTLALAGLYALWAATALAHGPSPKGGIVDERWNLRAGSSSDRLSTTAAIATPLLVYLAVTALSLVVASDPLLASFGLAVLVEAALLFIYVVATVRTPGEVQVIVALLLIGLLAEGAFVGLTKFVGIDPNFLGLGTRIADSGIPNRFGGTLGNPNVAGSYFAFLLAPALATVWWSRRTWMRWLGAAAFAAGVIGLFLTLSRGGWLAFALSMIVLLVLAARRGWLGFGRIALAGVGLAAVLVPFVPDVISRINSNQEAALSRVPLMRIARDMIFDNPLLGVGANNFTLAEIDYLGPELTGEFIAAVHNKFLLIWAEAGPVALAAFVWFLLAIIGRGWRVTREGDPVLSPLALGLLAGFIGQIAHMMVEPYHFRSQIGLLVLVAALLGAMSRLPKDGARYAR